MKHTVFGVILTMVFLLLLSCELSIESRSVRQNELDRMIDTAAEQTIKELKDSDTGISKEEFQTDFIVRLVVKIESDSSLTVNSMTFDEEKGLLSVEVEEHFIYPNGADGTVKATKNIVIES